VSGGGPEDQGPGPEGQVQEAGPEEGPHVGRRHAGRAAGLQAQGVHGPEGQPEAGPEGGEGGGACCERDSCTHNHGGATWNPKGFFRGTPSKNHSSPFRPGFFTEPCP